VKNTILIIYLLLLLTDFQLAGVLDSGTPVMSSLEDSLYKKLKDQSKVSASIHLFLWHIHWKVFNKKKFTACG